MKRRYSSADLLGKEAKMYSIKNPFIYWVESYLDRQIVEVQLTLSIPHSIWNRTRFVCSYIKRVYEFDLPPEMVVGILYKDFVQKVMKKYNLSKIYDELTKYDGLSSNLEIKDPLNNRTHIIKRKHCNRAEISIRVAKDEVKSGEFLASEMDDELQKFISVEELLSRLWINFFQSAADGNNEKLVDKLLKLAEQHF